MRNNTHKLIKVKQLNDNLTFIPIGGEFIGVPHKIIVANDYEQKARITSHVKEVSQHDVDDTITVITTENSIHHLIPLNQTI